MSYLVFGVAIWFLAHLIPSLARPLRSRVIARIGDGPYKGVFSIVLVISLVLIVIGWRATPQVLLYVLPPWSGPLALVLMIVAFALFAAATSKTVIKRFVRHPQLASVAVWAASHLLTNGTTRAVVLFGGLGLWALVEMPLINARDGAYVKPEAPAWIAELKVLAIAAVIFLLAVYLHPYFAGVPVVLR